MVRQGKHSDAGAVYRRASAITEAALGLNHPATATVNHNFAGTLLAQGKYGQAENLYRRVLSIRQRAQGAEHPEVIKSHTSLAKALQEQDKLHEAETQYRRALSLQLSGPGPQQPSVGRSRVDLGIVLMEQGKHLEAEAELRQGLAALEASDSSDCDLAAGRKHLALLLAEVGRFEEAIPVAEQAWTHQGPGDTSSHADPEAAFLLARLLWKTSRHPAARLRARDLALRAAEINTERNDHAAVVELEQWLQAHPLD